jgi:protein SCO1
MVRTHLRLLAVLLPLTLLLGACGSSYRFHGVPYEPPVAAPQFSGTNWDGSDFTLSALEGKVALVFFGYTACPDVCPTTLAEMRVLHEKLGTQAADVAVIFVSVDPERDTPARVAEYVPAFNKAFYGIHIPPADLETAKESYGVFAEKVYYDPQDTAAGYSVDHTARVYLIGKGGQLVTSYPYGSDIDNMQKDIAFLLK